MLRGRVGTLCSVRGMSSGRVEKLFPASEGYVQWHGGRISSCIRGMSSVRVAEFYPASGVVQ
ncbi:UNVERIFIED_CONTAM: hypothetical protein NCL1_16613 [Trichonephila clavipes]